MPQFCSCPGLGVKPVAMQNGERLIAPMLFTSAKEPMLHTKALKLWSNFSLAALRRKYPRGLSSTLLVSRTQLALHETRMFMGTCCSVALQLCFSGSYPVYVDDAVSSHPPLPPAPAQFVIAPLPPHHPIFVYSFASVCTSECPR